MCISRVTYTKYETGNRAIPTEVIKELAHIYSISTDFILGVSAKPEYVDYSNYHTKLSPQAASLLQNISDSNNSLSGFNALLESRYAHKIFYFLGLLLKFPYNYDDLLLEDEENVFRQCLLLAFKEDFTNTLNIPHEMFGIKEMDFLIIDDMYAPDMFENYFHIYITKFINEIRESPDTKKRFWDELKRNYGKIVKEELAEIEENYNELNSELENIVDIIKEYLGDE